MAERARRFAKEFSPTLMWWVGSRSIRWQARTPRSSTWSCITFTGSWHCMWWNLVGLGRPQCKTRSRWQDCCKKNSWLTSLSWTLGSCFHGPVASLWICMKQGTAGHRHGISMTEWLFAKTDYQRYGRWATPTLCKLPVDSFRFGDLKTFDTFEVWSSQFGGPTQSSTKDSKDGSDDRDSHFVGLPLSSKIL